MAPSPQQVGQEAAWVVLSPGGNTLTLSVYFRWTVGPQPLGNPTADMQEPSGLDRKPGVRFGSVSSLSCSGKD